MVRLVAAFLLATLAVLAVTLTTPSFWRTWGTTISAGVTAVATAVLVWVTAGNVTQAKELAEHAGRQADLTERLAEQAAAQRLILERQGMLPTLPAMVIESHGRAGMVKIKNKAQPPALNVEYRHLIESNDNTVEAGDWQWVNAVMARSSEKEVFRPLKGPVHVQVRFSDSLGTLYLVERRWLGRGGTDAYRLFRWAGDEWEHLTFRPSTQAPLDPGTTLPPDTAGTHS